MKKSFIPNQNLPYQRITTIEIILKDVPSTLTQSQFTKILERFVFCTQLTKSQGNSKILFLIPNEFDWNDFKGQLKPERWLQRHHMLHCGPGHART